MLKVDASSTQKLNDLMRQFCNDNDIVQLTVPRDQHRVFKQEVHGYAADKVEVCPTCKGNTRQTAVALNWDKTMELFARNLQEKVLNGPAKGTREIFVQVSVTSDHNYVQYRAEMRYEDASQQQDVTRAS